MAPESITNVLSTELLAAILHFLTYLELVHCRLVCKKFREIIDGTSALQLMIELGAAGDPGYTLNRASSTVDVLEHFRAVQKKYRAPAPRGSPKEYFHEVNLNSFITMPRLEWYEDGWWYQFGDYLVGVIQADMGAFGTYIDFIWLGTGRYTGRKNKTPRRYHSVHVDGQWELAHVDFDQDLLVLVILHAGFRFLSLQTGQPHPKMEKTLGGKLELTELMISVLAVGGEWVLVTFSPFGADNILYHWPSGKKRRVWPAVKRETKSSDIRGFIVDDFLIMPVPAADPPDDAQRDPYIASINVYALPKSGGEIVDPWLVAVYELPAIKLFTAHVESFQRVIATSAHTYWGGGPVQELLRVRLSRSEYCIQISVLLSERVRLARDTVRDTADVLHVPWAGWGPSGLHPQSGEVGLVPVVAAGLRVIYTSAILDFNQYDASRNIYSSGGAGATTTSADRPEDASKVYTGPVPQGSAAGPGRSRSPSLDSSIPELQVKGPRYRLVPCALGKTVDNTERADGYVIEEEDGPKVVEVLWSRERVPQQLKFRKF